VSLSGIELKSQGRQFLPQVPLAEQFVSFPIMAFANHIGKCRYVRQHIAESFLQIRCRANPDNPQNQHEPYIDYNSYFSYFNFVVCSWRRQRDIL